MTSQCDSYPDVSLEYICPKVGGRKSRKPRKTRKRTVSQLGGNCLYAGKPLSVNVACKPHDQPNSSQVAWSMRYGDVPMKGGRLCNFGDEYLNSEVIGSEGFDYGDCEPVNLQNGGDGYSVMPGKPIGGQPGFMRYTDSCRPVFPGDLLPKKVGGSKKRKKRRGIISSLVSGDIKLKNGNIRDMTKDCNSCSYTIAKGGALLGQAVHGLGDIIFPMSKNSLIALIVLLFSNHLVSKRKVTKKQMGGNLGEYLKIFVPMTKNNLVVLASVLLIHYFVKNKKKRIQKGGAVFTELSKLLAPLGVDQFGVSVVLLILNEAVRKNNKKRKQKGGATILHPLVELIAPLGVSAFISTGVILILDKMFRMKKDRLVGKTKKGGSMSSLVKDLTEKLSQV